MPQYNECIFVDGQDVCRGIKEQQTRWLCGIDMPMQQRFLVDNNLQQMDNYRKIYSSPQSDTFVIAEFNYDTERNDGAEHICIEVLDYFK